MLKKILILGGGFGGVRAALDLGKTFSSREAEITLIDRNNYHLFLPSLYEVASAALDAASAYGIKADQYQVQLRKTICIPYAEIFAGTKVNFMQAEVVKLDLAKKEVVTAGERVMPYDYLVLALGSETDTFGIPGVADYAYKFKTVDEAVFLNNRLAEFFQKAEKDEQILPLRVVIAGAGFNGLELAGELACCLENIRKSCRLGKDCISIKLVEAGPQILPMIAEKKRRMIEKRLKKLGVEILTNSSIEEVGPKVVKLKSGAKLETDFVIWTAGVRASSFLKNISGLTLNEQGRVAVNSFLQIEKYPELFAIGDNSSFVDPVTQKPVPGLAYVAIDEGKAAAENIRRLVKRRSFLKKYSPFYGIWVAPVGGKFAVAHLGLVTLTGFWGWALRCLIDLRYFLSILPLSKALNLFFKENKIFLKND